MAPFLAVFCGYAGVSAILAYFSHKSFLFRWLFFFGIFLLVKDVLSPVVAKGLIGQHERIFIEEPLLGIFAEFLALSGFIILGFFSSNQVLSKIFVPAAIVFIFVNTIFVIIQINWPFLHSYERRNGNYIEKATVSKEISRGNVYLICLDSFLGPAFLDVIKDSDLENSFEGFVYFPKNLANYDFTLPSLASVLSGSLYTKGSMQTWHDKAIMQSGILGMFSNLGYDIWQYADEKHNSVSRERYRTTTEKVSQLNKYLLMIDVWIVRISPTLIRKEIWEKLTKKNKIYNSAV